MKILRPQRKERAGVVVSAKMEKTRVVSVDRHTHHVLYEKVLRRKSRFFVHDEKNESCVGDRVLIEETRPLSKLKRWRIARVLERAPETEKLGEDVTP